MDAVQPILRRGMDALRPLAQVLFTGPRTWPIFRDVVLAMGSAARTLDWRKLRALSTGSGAGANVAFAVLCMVVCLVTGEVSGNFSQVDKLWTIYPVVASLLYAFFTPNPRVLAMTAAIVIWGLRLSYNFHRKGGFDGLFRGRPWEGEEDYRWPALRKWPVLNTRIGWLAFDIGFICITQITLLAGLAFPVAAAGISYSPLTFNDALVGLLWLSFFIGEMVADNEQWDFQTEKHRKIKNGDKLTGDYARGFKTTGLFAVSRHPNFFCEQAMWVCMAIWGFVGTGRLEAWYALPCLGLMALFQGSTWFTETLSAKKYKDYREYQRRVPMLAPNPLKLAAYLIGVKVQAMGN